MKLDKVIGGQRFVSLPNKDTGQSYVFDRYIFIGVVLFLLGSAIFLIMSNGGFDAKKNFYVKCSGEQTFLLNGSTVLLCKNPLYHEYKYCGMTWQGACDQEYIQNGFTYGTPKPKFLENFNLYAIILIALSFVFNHIVYNRKYRFGVK